MSRGDGVLGFYPFNAPRSRAQSLVHHQYWPDASIFVDASQKTPEILGTVVIRTTRNDTKRTIIALTIMAEVTSWSMCLTTRGRRTARSSYVISTYMSLWPSMKHRKMGGWTKRWCCTGWMAPYILLTPPGIIPIILLDSYQCHIMASVVNVIQDLGCKWFTSLLAAPDWCNLWTLATISCSKCTFTYAGRSLWSTIWARMGLSQHHCAWGCLHGHRKHIGTLKRALDI